MLMLSAYSTIAKSSFVLRLILEHAAPSHSVQSQSPSSCNTAIVYSCVYTYINLSLSLYIYIYIYTYIHCHIHIETHASSNRSWGGVLEVRPPRRRPARCRPLPRFLDLNLFVLLSLLNICMSLVVSCYVVLGSSI